jgi:hypothetical protein
LQASAVPAVHAHPTYVTQVLVGMVQWLSAQLKAEERPNVSAELRVMWEVGPDALNCQVSIVPLRGEERLPALAVTATSTRPDMPPVLDATADAWLPLVTRLGGRLWPGVASEPEGFCSLKLELPLARANTAEGPEVAHG